MIGIITFSILMPETIRLFITCTPVSFTSCLFYSPLFVCSHLQGPSLIIFDYFVGADSVPFSNGDWHAGAGVGVRYNTGIGPIRLDLATPANGDNAGRSLGVYIGIGHAF